MRLPTQRLLDVLLAAALVLVGFAEFTGIIPGTRFPVPHAVHPVFIVAAAAPLAVRRRWPLSTLSVVAVVQAVWQYAFYPFNVQPPFEPFVALIIAVYTAGAYADGRVARAVLVVIGLGTLNGLVNIAAGQPVGIEAPPIVILLVTFALGRAVAGYRRRAESERERAQRLERQQDETRRKAVAEERARIARELHDVISHDVSLMVLQASVERHASGADHDPRGQTLASIEATGREALAELRRMLGVLRRSDDAAPLEPQPGLAQLPELVDAARAAGLPVSLVVDGDRQPLTAGLDLAAYRIVQESLTNAAKHAPGRPVTATVRYQPGGLELEIIDHGPPSKTAAIPSSGHGLVGMRERVALYGGSLEAGADPVTGGFRVRARIPLAVTA